MSRRASIGRVLLLVGATMGLAACGGKPEAGASSARKSDQSPVAGANAGYTAPGWKAGDATGWEQHMRNRTQSQNEYVRVTAGNR